MTDPARYSAADFETLNGAIRGKPLRPYERFQAGQSSAEDVVRNGWRLSGFPPLRLDRPIEWEDAAPEKRSYIFHLQSWDPVDPLLKEASGAQPADRLDAAFALADDWIARYPQFIAGSPAWYDMAVGMRAYRLAYLLDLAARLDAFDAARGAAWMNSLETHRDVLAREDFFARHSNHGFYQLCGQLAMGRRFEGLMRDMDRAVSQAGARLSDMLGQQFTREGVHKEHSPDYQRMLLDSMRALRETGLVEDAGFVALYDRVEESLAWFIMPNGRLVNFGDSDYRQMQGGRAQAARYLNPVMRHVASKGETGSPPSDWVKGFPESGYFVARNAVAGSDGLASGDFYLAQNLAFHSRTHKHADHLSFVWYDRGHEILIDAGRYGYIGRTRPDSPEWKAGYWYSDRRRMHVESSAAHNTLVIDGKDHERRNARPFGSALRAWGKMTDRRICYSCGEVRHGASIRHARTLIAHPGKWLIVLDWLQDGQKKDHQVAQWFHFAPDLKVVPEEGMPLTLSGEDGFQLRCASFVPGTRLAGVYTGCDDGATLQGWWSPREGVLEPAPAIAYEANGATACFITLFSLTQSLIPDREGSAWNGTLTKGKLRWQTEAAAFRIEFERFRDGQLALSYGESRHKPGTAEPDSAC